VVRDVLLDRPRDHPRFFAFVPSPSNYVGFLADALSSGFNVFAGTWLGASGPAMVELVTVGWYRTSAVSRPADGLFVSGGSTANLTALAVARESKLGAEAARGVAYASDQVHSSVGRALKVLGLRSDQLRLLPADDAFRLGIADLERAVAEDRAVGRQPFCVIANAGTTNTGSVDPLPELADLCAAEGLWLHADGAYGGGALLSERGKRALAGIERADAPPTRTSGCFSRSKSGVPCATGPHGRRFHSRPEHPTSTAPTRRHLDYGIQPTRLPRSSSGCRFRCSLGEFGAAVERGSTAERGDPVMESGSGDRRARPARDRGFPLGTWGCRRRGGRGDPGRAEASLADGWAFLSSTILRGKPAPGSAR
jgi:hypothetical protein